MLESRPATKTQEKEDVLANVVINLEAASNVFRLSPQNFKRLAEFIQTELGVRMPGSKVGMLQSRLAGRVRQLGMESIDEYCDHLFSPNGVSMERLHLFNAVTTNKTDFFREAAHFHFLSKYIMVATARLAFLS